MCKANKLGLSAFVSRRPHVGRETLSAPNAEVPHASSACLAVPPHRPAHVTNRGEHLNAAIRRCNVKSMRLTCSMSPANLSASQSLIKTVAACKHGWMRQHCNNIPQCGSPHHSHLISRLHCLPSPSLIPPLRNTSRGPQLLIWLDSFSTPLALPPKKDRHCQAWSLRDFFFSPHQKTFPRLNKDDVAPVLPARPRALVSVTH